MLFDQDIIVVTSIKPAFECVRIFFHVVHFLQDTACGSLKYTEADSSDSKLT